MQKNIIGTGGQNHNLKLYDLETQKKIFEEKCLPHDWLELKRRIWISDMDFLPSTEEIVTVSRYGNVRNTIFFKLILHAIYNRDIIDIYVIFHKDTSVRSTFPKTTCIEYRSEG